MLDLKGLVDSAVDAVMVLPSEPAFRAWCRAYRAGNEEEESAKRAFRSVWWGLARGRLDDFTRLLAGAEARINSLPPQELAGWAQASAVRAVLELMRCRVEATEQQRMKAGAIAGAALRFADAAKSRPMPVSVDAASAR